MSQPRMPDGRFARKGWQGLGCCRACVAHKGHQCCAGARQLGVHEPQVDTLEAQRFHGCDVSFLVMVVTDGGENASVRWNGRTLTARTNELQAAGAWTFAYQVPRGRGASFAAQCGVPPDNVREWEQTDIGTRSMGEANTRGVTGYYAAVQASAAPAQVAFFYVTTDLSKVSQTALKRKLDDVAQRFKAYDVKVEVPVKDFVEAKTKSPYVIGQAYYQLMKAERVQPQKAVLIAPKGSKAVYGGDEARELIGLPRGAEARVTPGNHSNYDIYVQSTSVNRKLPRGTKVLVDTAHTSGLTPTWDHTKLEEPKK